MSVFKGYPKLLDKKASFAALVVLALLAGCGGGGGGSSSSGSNANGANAGPPDNTDPTVTSMTPGEDTFGLGTNSKLTATLSEAMVPSLINTANFRLHDGNNFIAGTVSYDAVNHIAVFTPAGVLVPSTRYTATMCFSA
jgi:hypothetical protein